MKNDLTLNRRLFMAGQASVAAIGFSSVANASVGRTGPSWRHAIANDVVSFKGEKFSIQTTSGKTLSVELVDVESMQSDPNRPSFLPRSEGMTMSFACPEKLDAAIKSGQELVTIHHPQLGRCDIMMTEVPLRSGGTRLEAVFN